MALLHLSLRSARRAVVAPSLLWATVCRAASSDSSSSLTQLPPSLRGRPICELVPPGSCQFTPERIAVPLVERIPVSATSSVLRFGLPDPNAPLNLSTCACLLAHAKVSVTADPNSETATATEDVTRPYTPISTNRQIGSFDLLIKNYGPTSKMSRHLHEIQPGDVVEFSHIPQNVKIQAPFEDCDFIGMLAGGTGITPMIQALHAVLGDSTNSRTRVCLLYGSRDQHDILAGELLREWASQYRNRFTCVDVLSHEPTNSDWTGRRGWIDRSLIEEHFPPPSSDRSLKVFVCGPPPMYDALSGPRQEADKVTGILGDMGYTPEHVYKF